MLTLGYVEVWNPKIHGFGNGFKPIGHFIQSNFTCNLDEFYKLKKDEFIIRSPENKFISKLHLIQTYNIEDYTLCSLHSYRIKIFQRLWRKKKYGLELID